MTQTLLIDADPILHRAAQCGEYEFDFRNEVTLILGDLREAQNVVRFEIKKLEERFPDADRYYYLTGSENFRKKIYPEYKGNRTKRKPAGYAKLKDWFRETYPLHRHIYCYEADDLIADAATRYKDYVVVSPDKDLRQVPGPHFDGKEEFFVTPEQALRFKWTQVLTGDPTDGYKGIPGVGAVVAKKLLKDCIDEDDYKRVVVKAYEDHNLSLTYMNQMIQVATIGVRDLES